MRLEDEAVLLARLWAAMPAWLLAVLGGVLLVLVPLVLPRLLGHWARLRTNEALALWWVSFTTTLALTASVAVIVTLYGIRMWLDLDMLSSVLLFLGAVREALAWETILVLAIQAGIIALTVWAMWRRGRAAEGRL